MTTSAAKSTRNTLAIQEYSAFVFAGLGGNLSPLTDAENVPKALLPVANKALISYPLSWIEKAGITQCIILCIDVHESALNTWLRTNYRGSLKPVLFVASTEEIIEGSADALRNYLSKHRDQIKNDVVLISCDTVTDLPPFKILDNHRLSGARMTSLFHRLHTPDIMTPPKKGSRSITSHAPDMTLLGTSAEADIDDEMQIRSTMLWKFPRVIMTSTLIDAHLYICSQDTLDIISRTPISRINTDLVPLLAKAQYQDKLADKYGISGRINIFVGEEFSARCNTRQAYIDLNRHTSRSIDLKIEESASVGDRTTIGQDSQVGHTSTIAEKSTIKRSIIANNVRIGMMCRINGCIIMEHTTIGDNVKLDNCILARNVTIHEKSTLKDCTIAATVIIQKGSEVKGEDILAEELRMD